ncbi:DUF692 family multinuclear iron-containing protein [Actinophytocola sp.]|uniref:multinuclear nonheme iron-dependent oxidase n=1 Tax=Actinophytocola sp. TaxID=1872138 RepID=UPI00389AC34C
MSGLPRLGSGVGYRRCWDSWLRGGSPGAEWVEVVVERCRTLPAKQRTRLGRLPVPVVPHGVEPAFDVPGEMDAHAMAAAAGLVAEWGSPWFSGHLWPSRLRPEKSLHTLSARAQCIQDGVGVPFLLEIAEYDVPGVADLATAVLEHCDCGLVLNLALLRRAAREHGVDASEFLRRLPAERVAEVHLTAGGTSGGGAEAHGAPVGAQVWDLFAELTELAPVRASVVERDGTGGGDLAQLCADLDRARVLLANPAPA